MTMLTNEESENNLQRERTWINVKEEKDNLVTPQSLALSLAPPRGPPLGSIHRNLLIGKDPLSTETSDVGSLHPHNHHKTRIFRDKWKKNSEKQERRRWGKNHQKNNIHVSTSFKPLPHPHLPLTQDMSEKFERYLGALLSISYQHHLRDSGKLRSIFDNCITSAAPALAIQHPNAVRNFLNLSKRMQKISYGEHELQEIHLFEPEYEKNDVGQYRGLLFFVHGGAWGSNLPWMYRLTALPFLKAGIAVAIVGYRTYPDADVKGQVEDLELAASKLAKLRPDLLTPPQTNLRQIIKWSGLCLCGHSSGAHIALFMLIERVRKTLHHIQSIEEKKSISTEPTKTDNIHPTLVNISDNIHFNTFIGLSGPYNISDHFDFEANRGVEELSPMKPACGYSREQFLDHSPAIRLSKMLIDLNEQKPVCLDQLLPKMLLVHGTEDGTVPFTSTSDCARLLRACGASRCEELYLGKTGHEDTIMHIMLGGKSRDAVMEWFLKKYKYQHETDTVGVNIRLQTAASL